MNGYNLYAQFEIYPGAIRSDLGWFPQEGVAASKETPTKLESLCFPDLVHVHKAKQSPQSAHPGVTEIGF